ncbi:MAG: transposase [Candidatus Undinarchaeales archaeon]|jgi:putative transposase|nr:transposase [Candidatus Undinarchaeales archaeon]MDP7494314.1 transposase [Candidatus Undinarchaeales archaeon]
MIVHRGYKTELKLNNTQRTTCLKHAGTARFTYNWGLARRIELYEKEKRSTNSIELHRELNRLKVKVYPWMYEVSKCAAQEALRDLDTAFKNFFTGRARYPRSRSRKRGASSFRLTGTIKVFENAIQLPRLGRLRLKERGYLPTDVHILSATVSERAGRWYVSVLVEEEIDVPINGGPSAGVDLGIERLATVSDGTVFKNPRSFSRYERKLRRMQRSLARKRKGSKNRKKTVHRIQRVHARIGNIRRDAIHKATSWLARTKSVVVVEDLNVSGMMNNKHLSKAVSDVGFNEFRQQLDYKTEWCGSRLVVADRFFPSSKRCSRCGHVKRRLRLSERTFMCGKCGLRIDRDLNASHNLEKLAVSCTESLNAREKGKRWPSRYCGGETTPDEAGIEHRLELF